MRTRSPANPQPREPARESPLAVAVANVAQTSHPRCSIRGVALDEDGAPLRESPLGWTVLGIAFAADGLPASVEEPKRGELVTDRNGRFELMLEDRPTEPAQWRELSLNEHNPHFLEARRGRWRLPDGAEGATIAGSADEIDLRNCTLVRPHAILSGRVVDPQGEPVFAAIVQARYSRGELELSTLGVVVSRGSDSEGRFELFGWADGARMNLEVTRAGWATEMLRDLITPTTGLVVRLTPLKVASLRVDIATDDPAQLPLLRARCSKRNAQGERVEPKLGPDSRGQFYLARPIEPGMYTVEIIDRQTATIYATIENVEVIDGEETKDPRIQPIDLRGKLRIVRIRTISSSGGVFPEQAIDLATSSERSRRLQADFKGWIEFTMPREAQDLIGIDALGRKQVLSDGSQIVVYQD